MLALDDSQEKEIAFIKLSSVTRFSRIANLLSEVFFKTHLNVFTSMNDTIDTLSISHRKERERKVISVNRRYSSNTKHQLPLR